MLAHAFLNFMLDKKNAYDNFVQSSATRRRRTRSTPTALVKQRADPESSQPAVLRPDQFANNQELLALSVEGSKLWQNAWAKFKAG